MHIPDGFLSAPVAGGTWLAGAGVVGVALHAERRAHATAPAGVLGALAAFVFAAQMVNVPVAPGTSGHLVGAVLVATLVGPWRAVIVMAAVLAVQSLLLQDGGLTALGANLLDMGCAGAFAGFAAGLAARRGLPGPRGIAAGGVLGAFAATLCGAAMAALWLSASGLYPLRGILPLLLIAHVPIACLEAVLTGAILVTVLRWRPDLLADAGGGTHRPLATAAGGLALAVLVAAFAAPFASSLPDGLERTALALRFADRMRPLVPAWLRGAGAGGALAAGLPLAGAAAGALFAALVAWMAVRALSKPHAGSR